MNNNEPHGMLFGLDANGWVIIIGSATVGIGGIILQSLNAYFAFRREMAQIERDKVLHDKVTEIGTSIVDKQQNGQEPH